MLIWQQESSLFSKRQVQRIIDWSRQSGLLLFLGKLPLTQNHTPTRKGQFRVYGLIYTVNSKLYFLVTCSSSDISGGKKSTAVPRASGNQPATQHPPPNAGARLSATERFWEMAEMIQSSLLLEVSPPLSWLCSPDLLLLRPWHSSDFGASKWRLLKYQKNIFLFLVF